MRLVGVEEPDACARLDALERHLRARSAEGAARKYFSGNLDARSQDQHVLIQLVHLSDCHGSEIRAAGCFFDFFHLCCTFGL